MYVHIHKEEIGLLNILTFDSSIFYVGFVAAEFYKIKCSFIEV